MQAVDSLIVETTKILTRGGNREDTWVVATTRHDLIIDHGAVEVRLASLNPSATAAASASSPLVHQENNTLLGWLEMLETTRLARDTRSSFKILKKFL